MPHQVNQKEIAERLSQTGLHFAAADLQNIQFHLKVLEDMAAQIDVGLPTFKLDHSKPSGR